MLGVAQKQPDTILPFAVPEAEAAAVAIPILGSILDDLLGRVDETLQGAINSAERAGLNLEIEAGRQIAIAIENAKNAYKDSLQFTLEKVGKAINEQVDQLKSMVQSLESKIEEELAKIEGKVQQFILSLPFARTQTQLTRVQPRYAVAADGAKNVHFKFEGVFAYAATKGFEVELSFGEQKFAPVATTTQSLEFEIPIDLIVKDEKDAMTKNSYCLGNLYAPWDNGWWWSSSKVDSNYKVYLGLLPLTPGKITVEYTAKKVETVTKRFSSSPIVAWADSYYPKKWVVIDNTTYADSGWEIAAGVNIYMHDGAHGSHDPAPKVTRTEKNFVVTSIGLSAEDGKHMGRVTYHVEFNESQQQTRIEKREEEITLKWGDSVVLDAKENEEVSKITIDGFDGSHNEYVGPTLDNPYLKIYSEHGKTRLSAEIPKEIKLSEFLIYKA